MPTGATWYDQRRGETVYPVRPGFILRYKAPYKTHNKHIGAVVEHHYFVWILSQSPKVKGDRPQDRMIQRFVCMVPMLAGMENHVLCFQDWIRVRSLIKYLTRGYMIVAADVKWHRTDRSAKKFYKAVEEHLGVKLL